MSYTDGLQVAHDSAKYLAGNHVHYTQEAESQNEKSQAKQQPSICGVSLKVFFLTTVVATTITLAVALGAGLGAGLSKSPGSIVSSDSSTPSVVTITATATPADSTTLPTTSSVASSSSSASSGTSPDNNSDCPSSDNMNYTSLIFANGANGPVPSGAVNALTFQKRCGATIPVYQNLAETHVYSFDSCIDLCAGYNFWHNNNDCTGCTYNQEGTCWIKYGESLQLVESETDASAMLVR